MSGLELIWLRHASQVDASLWQWGLGPPLEALWWYEVLEQAGLEDQFEFYYAVVLVGDKQIACAPAFMNDLPLEPLIPAEWKKLYQSAAKIFPSLLTQRSFIFGSPFSDEGGVAIVPTANRLDVLRCLQRGAVLQARKLNAGLVGWKDFPTSYLDDLRQMAKSEGLSEMTGFPGTSIAIPPGQITDYLASLKSSHRTKLKKKWSTSQAMLPLDVEVLQDLDTAQMDEIFALFWQTYERAETKFERLNKRFFDLIAQRPESYFITLRHAETREMVAFMLCFVQGQHVINKFIGLDYTRPKEWLLYFRLWKEAVSFTQSHKATTMQSGQTGYQVKLEIGHHLLPLTNFVLHRNWLINFLFKRTLKDLSWATLDDDLALYLKAHPEANKNENAPRS